MPIPLLIPTFNDHNDDDEDNMLVMNIKRVYIESIQTATRIACTITSINHLIQTE